MSRHLGEQVSAYVDRRLPSTLLAVMDRHVVVCAHCRHAVDQERALLSFLRSAPSPGVSDSLHASLMRLASAASDPTEHGSSFVPRTRPPLDSNGLGAPGSQGAPGSHGAQRVQDTGVVPTVPLAPSAVRGLRLPTVAPTAPALHRSARRAALLAGLAAGASAAAAWGVGVVPATSAAVSPAVQVSVPSRLASSQSGMLSYSAVTIGLVGRPAQLASRSTSSTEPTAR
ncbi:MAG: zf-HC2 domain-containing protein [Candidatus Phosphoribacter sp.]|nr:hypothetical protein [Actinomycetales bacterium]